MKMSIEYMVELHKTMHSKNIMDFDEWREDVEDHLKYIPHRKLYRYRKCEDREILTLEKNAIWMANPHDFCDIFDATMPIKEMKYLELEFYFYLVHEISYKILEEMDEDDEEPIPEKEEFLYAMYEKMLQWLTEEGAWEKSKERLLDILGEDTFRKLQEVRLDSPKNQEKVNQTKEFILGMSNAPRNSLAIASFTTRYDNKSMWENYAQNYQGFCVEYDFADILNKLDSKKVGDVLHMLPVKYYHKLPRFNYTNVMREIIVMNINSGKYEMNVDDFLLQYYRAVTAKLYDYRAEQEWRLVMEKENRGEYKFPYVKRIFLGRGMANDNINRMKEVAQKLNVPLYIQIVNENKSGFDYKLLS